MFSILLKYLSSLDINLGGTCRILKIPSRPAIIDFSVEEINTIFSSVKLLRGICNMTMMGCRSFRKYAMIDGKSRMLYEMEDVFREVVKSNRFVDAFRGLVWSDKELSEGYNSKVINDDLVKGKEGPKAIGNKQKSHMRRRQKLASKGPWILLPFSSDNDSKSLIASALRFGSNPKSLNFMPRACLIAAYPTMRLYSPRIQGLCRDDLVGVLKSSWWGMIGRISAALSQVFVSDVYAFPKDFNDLSTSSMLPILVDLNSRVRLLNGNCIMDFEILKENKLEDVCSYSLFTTVLKLLEGCRGYRNRNKDDAKENYFIIFRFISKQAGILSRYEVTLHFLWRFICILYGIPGCPLREQHTSVNPCVLYHGRACEINPAYLDNCNSIEFEVRGYCEFLQWISTTRNILDRCCAIEEGGIAMQEYMTDLSEYLGVIEMSSNSLKISDAYLRIIRHEEIRNICVDILHRIVKYSRMLCIQKYKKYLRGGNCGSEIFSDAISMSQK